MGVLGSIKDKIFGKAKEAPKPAMPIVPVGVTSSGIVDAARRAEAAKAAEKQVDVEAILEEAVKAKGIKLNWRVSIVDLMKALDLDSSLAARKELAAELNYSGSDPDGSAEKNIWLHKALMKTLAENGGKIPKDLMG
jgi:hypothetical protein